MRRTWEGGRKDFPPTHHVSAGGWSRFAVFVRSPFRRGRALPRLASRWQSWFTLSRCQRERRFNLPEIALPLGPRLQRKTRPSRGERKRGDSGEGRRDAPRLESKSPANSTPPLLEMHRITSGVNLRTAGCVPVAGRRSDGCARGGGDWGTDHDPVVPALQRVGNNTHCTSAGAAAQISVGPAAHHRLPRQGQLPNQRCSAVGAQSRSNRSGQFPSSH